MDTTSTTPLVSALCVVYNQASYLRQCLDGLVAQETTFPYEIIIHDDASTDGSQDIIREYADRYPDRIRTILQEKNQFSQKKEIWATFLIPFGLKTYHRLYGHNWFRVMRYDVEQCLRYTFLRLTHRLPEQ